VRILVTSLPDLNKVAVQRYHHLLYYLSKSHEIDALCVNAWWLRDNHDNDTKVLLKDIKLSYITQKKINPVFQEFSIRKKLKGLVGFDVHVNFNSLIAGYLVSKNVKIPTVFDVCDDLPQRIRMSSRIPYILKPLGKSLGKIMLKKYKKT
jgi:hypothetical protein